MSSPRSAASHGPMPRTEGAVVIRRVRRATDEEWDRVFRDCDDATWFHSREWAEVWSGADTGSLRPAARMAEFTDGRCALLPLSEGVRAIGRGPVRRSSPGGTYGGWLSTDDLEKTHAALLLKQLYERTGGLVWRVNPWNELEAQVAGGAGRFDATRALFLDVGFEALVARFSKGHRSAARKALREGVEVSVATQRSEWSDYYAIYRGALERWGERATSSYSWDLFERLHALCSPNVRLWLAHRAGELLAGALVFHAGRHVVYWHGASRPDEERLRPVHGLLHEVIRDACEQGFEIFDLNPSGGHEGVEAFKKGFGAVEVPCPVIRTPVHTWRGAVRKLRERRGVSDGGR